MLKRQKIRLEPVTSELLSEIVRRIVAALDPDRIILFGSHAHGSPHEYSDIDLLVVKPGVGNPRDVAETIYGLFWDRAVEVDAFVITPEGIQEELQYGNSFLRQQILGRGRPLYERASVRA